MGVSVIRGVISLKMFERNIAIREQSLNLTNVNLGLHANKEATLDKKAPLINRGS
jgi:hypothetical protein